MWCDAVGNREITGRSGLADRCFQRKHGFCGPDDLGIGEIIHGEDDSVAGVVHSREKGGRVVAVRSDHC